MDIKFTVPGSPVPQGRPRVTRWGTYMPPRTVAATKIVHDFVQDLLEEDYEIVEKFMFTYEYDEGSYVFKEGAHGGYMFFIVDGKAGVREARRGERRESAKPSPQIPM